MEEYVRSEQPTMTDMGHLGRLAQMCARYCREFDEVIETAAAATSAAMMHPNERSNQLDRNLDYLNRGFKDLKRKFRENELVRRRGRLGNNSNQNENDDFDDDDGECGDNNNNNDDDDDDDETESETEAELKKKLTMSSKLSNNKTTSISKQPPLPPPVSEFTLTQRENNCAQQSSGTFKCYWKLESSSAQQLCGCLFNTNEDLNEHIKQHTTSELLSDLDFYYRTKRQLINQESASAFNLLSSYQPAVAAALPPLPPPPQSQSSSSSSSSDFY